jgi:hypothetical protein
MRCEHCGGVMAQQRRELLDHVDQLSIRAWRCRGCGGLMEEIRTCPPHRGGEARRIKYAVRALYVANARVNGGAVHSVN